MSNRKPYRVVVAGYNACGEPDFFFLRVLASDADYHAGFHYDTAREAAQEAGYDEPFVVFDENDAPWLIQRFDEENAYPYRMHYRCERCDVSWTSEWECACNDRCPQCDAEIEPHATEDIFCE